MNIRSETLHHKHREHVIVPVALVASSIFLILGLFLPVISLKELFLFKSTFSVVTGIHGLIIEGHQVLALIIFFFSIVFPIFKLVVLFQIWFTDLDEKQRAFYIHWLGILGKWSMLDVFVVAVTIVITKISKLAKAEPRIGIYFFGLSILLAMLVTEYIERLMRKEKKELLR